MQGVIQRPASHAANAQDRGDRIEVRWRSRPPAKAISAGRGARRTRRHVAGKREAIETLLVVCMLVALVAAASGSSGFGRGV